MIWLAGTGDSIASFRGCGVLLPDRVVSVVSGSEQGRASGRRARCLKNRHHTLGAALDPPKSMYGKTVTEWCPHSLRSPSFLAQASWFLLETRGLMHIKPAGANLKSHALRAGQARAHHASCKLVHIELCCSRLKNLKLI